MKNKQVIYVYIHIYIHTYMDDIHINTSICCVYVYIYKHMFRSARLYIYIYMHLTPCLFIAFQELIESCRSERRLLRAFFGSQGWFRICGVGVEGLLGLSRDMFLFFVFRLSTRASDRQLRILGLWVPDLRHVRLHRYGV